MPPARKRRRSQSTDTRSEENPSPLCHSTQKRRKKPATINYNPQDICQELYEAIRSQKTEDGRLLCEPFIRVPKRRTEPDYYVTVTTPMDLLKIQHKLKSEEYDDVEAMSSDVELLVKNAQAFYAKTSPEYKQAQMLWELFHQMKSRLISQAFGETVAEETDPPQAEEEEEDDEAEEEDEQQEEAADPLSSKSELAPLKVPVLKLKVSGAFMDSSDGARVSDRTRPAAPETSSDVETMSENQSMTAGRLSSSSEQDDQSSEVVTVDCQQSTTCHDLLRPKRSRKKQQTEVAGRKDKQEPVTDDDIYEQMFMAIVMATDDQHSLSDMFKILPSRSKLPDYYQVIKEPMDLRRIAIKIQTNSYTSLDDLVKDLLLMVQNAKTFNEPGSQIYKDASSLRKIILTKKHDLELSRSAAHPIRSQRIRLRCSGGSQNLSSIIAALKSESDDEGSIGLDDSNTARSSQVDQGESDMEYSGQEDDTSELWALFNAVKNYKTSLGQLMSDPFLRLPSKRIYPDYYLEIKRPMSLMKIQKKLKNGRYDDLDDLCTDLNLVFENAKQYNMEESKIFKDAAKLQLVMRGKKQELLRSKEAAVSEDLPEVRSSRGHVDVASVTSDEGRDPKRKRSRSTGGEDQLKKRLWLLYRTVLDYQCGTRRPVDMFRTLPLKKDYPDYYKVISEAIDMTMIENKIKLDKYCTQAALVSDFELMFNNARHYNEEGSQVFKDATLLEQVLLSQVRSLPQIDESTPSSTKSSTRSRPKVKPTSSLMSKLQELYGAIRDYNDARGRTLSTPFMKLPSRSDYPDYYEIIKKPVDMQKVFARMMANQYHGIEDMVSDLVLMFDNACRYNEPESLIYKDALTLQRVCLEKKSQLCSDDDSNEVPDVQALVQELMMNLFISTYSHTDEEGRCFSDSFLELPSCLTSEEGDDDSKKPIRMAPSFEQIKRNLDRGYYKRVDCFQEDMFDVFEYARKVSSIDSQVYEDCVELQLYFIQQRDELCKRGEILLTPALSHTEHQLMRHVEANRKERMTKEQRDDEERKKLGSDTASGHGAPGGGTACSKAEDDTCRHGGCESGKDRYPGSTDTFESNGQVYHIGDFVYIEPREKGLAPHIVCIEHLHKGDDGDQWLHGCWFLRPNETYHLATRKFLQKEVFKSDFYDSVPFDKVLGKCYIMCVKEYFKLKPEGLSDEDVYVCESRYSGRHKMFKKIKIWQVPKNEHVRLVPRDHVLTPVRVASVFADKAASDLDRQADEEQTDPSDRNRELVVAENVANAEEGCTYYEQYQAPTCWIKLGDCVYLRSGSEDKPLIARVDKIWTSSSGDAFFHGPYFVTPSDIEHSPTRLFYRKEVFLSAREQTNPVLSVTGRCSVLSYKEFTACRVTEIPETHVYICESKYLEAEKVVKKYNKPLKRVPLSISVCDDEIYFFKKPILPRKEPSPLLLKSSEVAGVEEESVDFCSSIDQSFNDTSSYQGEFSIDQTPTSGKKKKKQVKKIRTISGYIVYAGECRKGIQNENPDFNFGEISKAVGTSWKALPKEVKERYEERAKVIAAEQAAKAQRSVTDGLSQFPMPSPSADSRSMSPHPGGRPTTPGGNQGLQSMAPPPAPPKPPGPLFVTVPPRTSKLVHSDVYLRYIEGLAAGSRSVGDWDKTLTAAPPEAPPANPNPKLPAHWLGNGPGHHENVTSALWALRDLMLRDALAISRSVKT